MIIDLTGYTKFCKLVVEELKSKPYYGLARTIMIPHMCLNKDKDCCVLCTISGMSPEGRENLRQEAVAHLNSDLPEKFLFDAEAGK